jgi:ketosteroid isomerase-like protein
MVDAASFFKEVDAMDAQAVGKFLAEDAVMIFGNADPMVGREAIVAGNAAFMTSIKRLSHRLLTEWAVADAIIAHTEVTYLRLDDKEVTIPAVTILRTRDDGLFTHLQVFYDPAPIFAP